MADTDEALNKLKGLRHLLLRTRWTHIGKGGTYHVIDLGLDKTRDELVVVYRHINSIGRMSPFCTRTVDNFLERFKSIQ